MLRTAAVAALVIVALGACGDNKDSVKAKDQPTTTTLDPDRAVSSPRCSIDPDAVEVPLCDDANPNVAYDRVEAQPGVGENIRAQAFESAIAEGDHLLVRYVSGVESCYVLDRVDVVETGTEVAVTLYIGARPGADVCIELAKYYEVLVPLDEPLGNRKVVNGPLAVADLTPVDELTCEEAGGCAVPGSPS